MKYACETTVGFFSEECVRPYQILEDVTRNVVSFDSIEYVADDHRRLKLQETNERAMGEGGAVRSLTPCSMILQLPCPIPISSASLSLDRNVVTHRLNAATEMRSLRRATTRETDFRRKKHLAS